MSREHIFPAWMRDLFPDVEEVDYNRSLENLAETGSSEEDNWTAAVFSQTVRDVCEQCNNGWMSTLEGAVKPLLSGPMTDQPCRYSLTDQHAIAVWATKTVLVALRAIPKQPEVISPPMYKWFAEHRTPLPNSIIWLGRYDGQGEWPTTFKLHAAGYGAIDKPQPPYDEAIKGFHAAFAAGNLAFFVFGIPDGPRIDGFAHAKRLLIWPNVSGDVAWPPPSSVSAEELKSESAELPGPPA
jgi:hypothetical protein